MGEDIAGLSFEEAVARLEETVAALESGTLSLDESMQRFEQAVALSRHCAGRLDAAERQISVLEADEYLRPAGEIPRVKEPTGEYYDAEAEA